MSENAQERDHVVNVADALTDETVGTKRGATRMKFTYIIKHLVTDGYMFEADSIEDAKKQLEEGGLIDQWEGDPTWGKDHVDSESLVNENGKEIESW